MDSIMLETGGYGTVLALEAVLVVVMHPPFVFAELS